MRKKTSKEITSMPTVTQLEAELNRTKYRHRYHRVLRNTLGTLITVAAAGTNPVVFHWWIVVLAVLVGCASVAVGYWNYRRKKEE